MQKTAIVEVKDVIGFLLEAAIISGAVCIVALAIVMVWVPDETGINLLSRFIGGF